MWTEFPGAIGGVAAFLGVALDGRIRSGVKDIAFEVGVWFVYWIVETRHDEVLFPTGCFSFVALVLLL